MRLSIIVAAVAAGLAAIPAFAQDRTEVGVLDCTIEGGAGFILGSSKDLSCVFDPAGEGPNEAYVGVVNKVGVDIGVTGESIMKWAVLAPSASPWPAGALAGSYVGASAEATAAIGAGANVLIGGSSQTIALQPLSIQGQTGLNLAVGVAEFRLQPAG